MAVWPDITAPVTTLCHLQIAIFDHVELGTRDSVSKALAHVGHDFRPRNCHVHPLSGSALDATADHAQNAGRRASLHGCSRCASSRVAWRGRRAAEPDTGTGLQATGLQSCAFAGARCIRRSKPGERSRRRQAGKGPAAGVTHAVGGGRHGARDGVTGGSWAAAWVRHERGWGSLGGDACAGGETGDGLLEAESGIKKKERTKEAPKWRSPRRGGAACAVGQAPNTGPAFRRPGPAPAPGDAALPSQLRPPSPCVRQRHPCNAGQAWS